MNRHEGQEEQYVLRIVDPAVAEKLRSVLREEGNLSDQLQLSFPDNGRQGKLTLEGVDYPVYVLDLPTIVESYKTYDDVNLVKTGDVGQLLLVGNPPRHQLTELTKAQAVGGPGAAVESVDGVTPPMNNARSRHLRPKPDVSPEIVSRVEDAVVDILDGAAPAGMVFEDFEEEYVIDSATGRGRWQPVSKQAVKDSKQQQKEKERQEKEAEMMEIG